MTELIANLERADGPDRELDLDIALAIGLLCNPVERGCWVDPGTCIDGDKEPGSSIFVAPAYTASIDAAMTLVPEGWGGTIGFSENRLHNTIKLGRSYPTNASVFGEGRTPALALCIADLHAKEKN